MGSQCRPQMSEGDSQERVGKLTERSDQRGSSTGEAQRRSSSENTLGDCPSCRGPEWVPWEGAELEATQRFFRENKTT